jgi:GT2 family glycosyltransferase
MHPKLSIIIINYNTAVLTFDCVVSIIKKTPEALNFEIIVVDNGSNYADFLILKEKIEALGVAFIKLVRSKSNSGFSSGNMIGVQQASGEFLAFVNNDVVFIEDSFSSTINYLKEHADVGVVGLQPIFENGEKQVAFGHFDTFANRFLGYWLYEKLFPKKTKRHKTYFQAVEVDYVVGSFMLFRSSDFYKINGFDTNIFLYFEEMDICKRLKMINLKSVFIPLINYIHLNGMSTNLGYVKKIELKVSHLYVVRKNHGYFSYIILKYFFIIIFALKAIFSPKHFKMLFCLITMGAPLAQSIRHKQIILDK